MEFPKYSDAMRDGQREYISKLLAHCDGKVGRASRTGGINRTHLNKLMAKHGLKSAQAMRKEELCLAYRGS